MGIILNEMRYSTRILVYFSQELFNEIIVRNLFEICGNLKFLQIIAIFKDFQYTRLLYGYEPFSQNPIRVFNYENRIDNLEIYGNVLQNLNGHKIKSIVDQIEPRSLLHIDEDGVKQVSGYVVNLLKAFAYKHNATLIYPYPMHVGKVLFYGDVADKTRAGLLDLPASLLPSTGIYDTDALLYPSEQMNYCLMVPLSRHMHVNDIYALLIDVHVYQLQLFIIIIYSIIVLLNEHSPTYVEWQWRKFRIIKMSVLHIFCDQPLLNYKHLPLKSKFVYVQMMWLVFILNAMYGCYLGSLLTSPPIMPEVKNFDNFAERNITLYIAENEWKLYISDNAHNDFWEQSSAERVIKFVNYKEFLDRRKTMDPTKAYPVTSTRWFYFQERQKLFERPLFYFNKKFCLANTVLLSIPVQYNSIYVEAVNRVILQTHQSGLMKQWLSQGFLHMVKLKRVPLQDLSPPLTYGGKLETEDLQDLFIFLSSGCSVGLVCFICECHWQFIKKVFKKIQSKILKFMKKISKK